MGTSSTKAFELSNSSKLRTRAQKFDRPAPASVEGTTAAPAPRINYFADLSLDSKIKFDNSLDEVIDVVPDTRYWLPFIVYNVIKLYSSAQERTLTTPASMVWYCYMIMYGFFLSNDKYGRPRASARANWFVRDDARLQLLDFLEKAYVPPFMLTLFHGLADCSDPRRPGLTYFATLAGSMFTMDFGRLLPPQMFLAMHNITASADTSRDVPTAMAAFLNTIMFAHGNGMRNSIYASNYVSAAFQADEYNASWMYKLCDMLFSPVCGKTHLRRSNIEKIRFTAPEVAINSDVISETTDPYTHFLLADEENVFTMTKMVEKMSLIMKADFDAKFQLGAISADLSGVSILVHGYSNLALPTFHSKKHEPMTKSPTEKTDKEYAKAISFLQEESVTRGTEHYTWPDDDTNLIKKFYLILKGKYKSDDEPDKDVLFTKKNDLFPGVFWLDPYTEGDGPISYAMICGLLIESAEIDGSSVPMPNPAYALSIGNRYFLQGAVDLRYISKKFHNTAAYATSVLARVEREHDDIHVSHDLYDLSSNRIGTLNSDAPNLVNAPYGFNIIDGVRASWRMFSKLVVKNGTSPANKANLHVWTPYRHVVGTSSTKIGTKDIYAIFNFVTNYGTHIPLVETRHPSQLLPSS